MNAHSPTQGAAALCEHSWFTSLLMCRCSFCMFSMLLHVSGVAPPIFFRVISQLVVKQLPQQ